jgi:glycerol-3-phosphate dehydrogenase
MRRALAQLSERVYDALIIGGGIYGVSIARDAALRGLSVALLEKGDFGHATSSNSLRIIHGGLRYLQHGDIRRMRQSIRERKILMRIASHLVHPLPFLIPTYEQAMRTKAVLFLAMLINDLVGIDRNHSLDPQQYIPRGRIISKDECLRLVPGVERNGLTGGAIFYDGQVSNAERLIISTARSAVDAGAAMANYVEVTGPLEGRDRMAGVTARDALTGDKLEIRASIVINASGPWVGELSASLNGAHPKSQVVLSKAFNLLLKRQLISDYAVGVYSKGHFRDRDAILSKGSRLYFITPWRGRSLIGTAHLPYDAHLGSVNVTEAEIQAFLKELNAAYPEAHLERQDVCFAYGGLLPAISIVTGNVQLAKHPMIRDHRTEGGLDGLISVVGVKFTEARRVAEQVVDLVFRKLGRTPPESTTAITPVHGGQIEQFNAFVVRETQRRSQGLSAEAIRHLIACYGAEYPRVLNYHDEHPASTHAITIGPFAEISSPPLIGEGREKGTSSYAHGRPAYAPGGALLKAEVLHAVHEEMACKLTDVVFRRTTFGLTGDPGDACLNTCAALMAKELGWDASRTRREVEEGREVFATKS